MQEFINFVSKVQIQLPKLSSTFIEQLLSNFLATIGAGFLLYFILEKKIKDSARKDEVKRRLTILASDLSYNFVRAQKSVEHKDEYLNSNRFTLSQYETRELRAFYYQKPLPEKDRFPYTKLIGLITKLEDNNVLAQQVFNSSDIKAIRENKVQYFKNANEIMIKIKDFLTEVEPFYISRGIVLTGYS